MANEVTVYDIITTPDGYELLEGATVGVLLVASSYVPDSSHQYVADVVADEVTGTGYARQSTSVTRSFIGGRSCWFFDDPLVFDTSDVDDLGAWVPFISTGSDATAVLIEAVPDVTITPPATYTLPAGQFLAVGPRSYVAFVNGQEPDSDGNVTVAVSGVPGGGSTGQVLAKLSGDDFDSTWQDQVGGGGLSGAQSIDASSGTADLDAAQTAYPTIGSFYSTDIPDTLNLGDPTTGHRVLYLVAGAVDLAGLSITGSTALVSGAVDPAATTTFLIVEPGTVGGWTVRASSIPYVVGSGDKDSAPPVDLTGSSWDITADLSADSVGFTSLTALLPNVVGTPTFTATLEDSTGRGAMLLKVALGEGPPIGDLADVTFTFTNGSILGAAPSGPAVTFLCYPVGGGYWSLIVLYPATGGGAGTGDVVGPSSSVDFNVALFDGTTGKKLRDGGYQFTPASIGAPPTSRTLAGLDLSADRSAAAIKTALAIAESDVTNLTTDLAAKVPDSRTLAGLDLTTNRSASALRTALGLVPGTDVQAYDADLAAIAALTTDAFGLALLTKTTSAAVRTYLGLVLGTDVQAYHANLAAFAGLTLIADRIPYADGTGTLALAVFTATGRSIMGAANAAAARTAIGTVIGTDVEAHSTDLTTISGLSPVNDDLLQRKSGAWTNRNPTQVKADLAIGQSDVSGLTSALATKAPLASPVFTGTPNFGSTTTVTGITAAMVGAPAGSGTHSGISSGTNTGDETVTSIGGMINGTTTKNTPVDADSIGLSDSAASSVLKQLQWSGVKATLKTYFDTLYNPSTSLIVGRLSADATAKNADTTLSNVTGLAFAVGAGTVWAFRFLIFHHGPTAADAQFTVTVPSGATIKASVKGNTVSVASPPYTDVTAGVITTSGTAVTVGAPSSSGIAVCTIEGVVVCSATPGNVQVQFAQAVSTGTDSIVEANTSWRAERIS